MAKWRKSSHSDGHQGACIELAALGPHIGARDSKDPAGPKLLMGREQLAALLTAVRQQGSI